MTQPSISVESVGKRYRKGQTGYRTLREDLYSLTGRLFDFGAEKKRDADAQHMWALRDVTFEIKPGERVGIIGRNGSGKTTLLRLLAGVTRPTRGQITVRGRLGVLIEIMAGFHPELTGRENVYLNGAIMGMSRKEIKGKFDEIVAFAELEDWIDTPIKRYSSGMHVRLGFAVAAHLDPDILLVDEVLAVGDAAFQQKCLGKMDTAAQEGRTVVFVSHNMTSVRRLCERGIALCDGRAIFDGASSDAVSAYLDSVMTKTERRVTYDDDPSKVIAIRQVAVVSPEKAGNEPLDISDSLIVEILYRVRNDVSGTVIVLTVNREGQVIFPSWDTDTKTELFELRRAGDYACRISLPQRLLRPGLHTLSVRASRPRVGPIDGHDDCLGFELHSLREDLSHSSDSRPGMVTVPLTWEVKALTNGS